MDKDKKYIDTQNIDDEESKVELSGTDCCPGDNLEDALTITLSVLGSAQGRDIEQESRAAKNRVRDMIAQKTSQSDEKTAPTTRRNHNNFKMWLISAAACAAVALITGIATYTTGYREGVERLTASAIEINTPQGTTTKVALPDGSTVTLNGGSRLTYPSLFADDVRKVSLDGEGFFEVEADPAHPFVIASEDIGVRVLGTKFSLKSYGDDPDVSLTLVEGSVQAEIDNGNGQTETLTMKPNQQLKFNRTTSEISKNDVNAKESAAWRDGKLYFRNITLGDIARQLERKFNVKIEIYGDKLPDKVYFCQFENGENLEQILSLLSYRNDWRYSTSGKTITISDR